MDDTLEQESIKYSLTDEEVSTAVNQTDNLTNKLIRSYQLIDSFFLSTNDSFSVFTPFAYRIKNIIEHREKLGASRLVPSMIMRSSIDLETPIFTSQKIPDNEEMQIIINNKEKTILIYNITHYYGNDAWIEMPYYHTIKGNSISKWKRSCKKISNDFFHHEKISQYKIIENSLKKWNDQYEIAPIFSAGDFRRLCDNNFFAHILTYGVKKTQIALIITRLYSAVINNQTVLCLKILYSICENGLSIDIREKILDQISLIGYNLGCKEITGNTLGVGNGIVLNTRDYRITESFDIESNIFQSTNYNLIIFN